jgi:protein tyrosine/serine phosphatase
MKHLLPCLLLLCATPLAAQQPVTAAPHGELPVAAGARPANWAAPIQLDGVPNLHRISDHLYRSEQPTAQGFRNLEKLGIRTVINLRYFNSDDEEAEGTGLNLQRVKILTWRAGDEHVIEVMRMLRRKENGPFLIHCQHGADRTGLMSALYRMLEEDWRAEDALAELVDGGYGFHKMWKNIRRYVLSVDVSRLRAAIDAASAISSTNTVTDN